MEWSFKEILKLKEVQRRMKFTSVWTEHLHAETKTLVLLKVVESLSKRDLKKWCSFKKMVA